MKADKLKSFLYILMRDELPTGVIERIMKDHVDKVRDVPVEYSSKFLSDYAEDLVRRIDRS